MKKYLSFDLIKIFFFGISSGLPLALIMSTLSALLYDHGFNLKMIGFFSLATLPYIFKIAYAPIIDSFGLPYLTKIFGQRRSWLIFSQILLIIFISLIGIFSSSNNLALIAFFAFMSGFSSAMQDIVIDAYRIEIIKKEDQGIAVSLYVYGYRVGILISGAGALILSSFMDWKLVYLIMASLIGIGIVTTLFAIESRKNWVAKNYSFISWVKSAILAPLKDLIKRSHWYIILAFIVSFKLADVFAGNLTTTFLLDIKFSKAEIAAIVKTFGLFATLIGVFIGGILIKKIGINKSLIIAVIMQMVSNLGFSYQAYMGNNPGSLYLVIFAENFSSGIGDAVLITYLSGLCNIAFSATQYSLFISLASLSRSLLASSSGIVATWLGWSNFFIFSTLLASPSLIFLWLLMRKED
jgi:PAT family beta-lactamase induction signal transducer AmpG